MGALIPRKSVGIGVAAWVFALSAPALAQRPRPAAPASTPKASKPAPAPVAPPSAERGVQGQGGSTKAASKAEGAGVVSTEEGKEGVKTYKFGAVEVESRLKSPELIYFLRRVRAEFTAGDLGHRTFLRELADTERLPAFR